VNNAVPLKQPTLRLAFVAALIAIQVVVAVVMLLGPRPSPFGWQMYSAAPPRPEGFAIQGDEPEPIDVESWLTHARVEVDYAAVLRANGCVRTGADAIRIEFPDGSVEEVTCR
jgi:hypothetical protein